MMAYFEIQYFGTTFLPLAADVWGNSESETGRTLVGQIDKPDGVRFRVNLSLPGARQSMHDTEQEAANAAITEGTAWLERMGLTHA
jgi:hypothetical protein